MIIFSNTTPLIAHAAIQQLDLLPTLFNEIYVVDTVVNECARGGKIAVTNLTKQARVRDWPEIMVIEKTREQALQQVRTRLIEYLAQPVIVKIEVPSPLQVSNHWLTHFGCCREDPTFDQLEVEIAKYRRQREEGDEKT